MRISQCLICSGEGRLRDERACGDGRVLIRRQARGRDFNRSRGLRLRPIWIALLEQGFEDRAERG